jgi:hypothetical protein
MLSETLCTVRPSFIPKPSEYYQAKKSIRKDSWRGLFAAMQLYLPELGLLWNYPLTRSIVQTNPKLPATERQLQKVQLCNPN